MPPSDLPPAEAAVTEPESAELINLRRAVEDLRGQLGKFEARQREGFAVDFHDFPYHPQYREWSTSPGLEPIRKLIAAGESSYLQLFERFCGLDAKFREIPVLPAQAGPREPYWENWWMSGYDAVILYGLVATHNPATFLEIGSGNSTKFVARAIRDFGLRTKIISIDPHPTQAVDELCSEVIRDNFENTDLSVFAELGAGDMVFVDNSHRSFQNSDVTVFFTETLSTLPPGVIYGLHDTFLPWDYPAEWSGRFYNEQYLLATYILGGAGGDQILLPGQYIARSPQFAHLRRRLFVGAQHLDWLTGSFWMVRRPDSTD